MRRSIRPYCLVILNSRGKAITNFPAYGTYQYGSFNDGYASFTPLYVVNGADPQAKIKHIMDCAKLLDGYV
jgi:hypothetical protein